jgi:hypothetical protein
MEVADIIAIAFGVVGTVFGFLGWRKADEANRIAADSNTIARESKSVAEDSNRIAVEANDIARTGTDAAKESVDLQLAADKAEKTARIVVRTGESAHSSVPSSLSGDQGSIGARLANEGPAVARDVVLHVTLPDGSTRSTTPRTLLEPETEYAPAVRIYPSDFGENDTRTFTYRVTYRDGNGPQEFGFRVRIEGSWASQWRTYKEPLESLS